MSVNVADLIAARAEADPKRPAIIHGSQCWNYGELIGQADRIASRLRELLPLSCPVEIAPRVGLFCENGPEYVALALGILRAGACLVPVAQELADPERETLVRQTAQHLILASGARPWLPGAAEGEESTGVNWQWLRQAHCASFPEDRFAALSPAFVRFSSGTTGVSKGVVIGHASLLERVRSANRRLQIDANDRVLWTLSMAHHFAVSIVLYLLHGATTVLEGSHLASELLATARATGASVIYGSPFHYALLAAEESGRDWPSLRLAVSTAAALGNETASAFRERYGVPLTQGLGIIEAGLPLLNSDGAEAKPLSVGRTDDFEVEVREGGELYLRGPGLFDAYLLPWRERQAVLEGGWFATGDLAEIDSEGHVWLRGRSKSVINIGGMKVFPEEVEAVLDAHPGVESSRVRGESHARWEQIAIAEIVPADPEHPPAVSALARHCRERLAAYKVPVRFNFVGELPRTASGKLRR